MTAVEFQMVDILNRVEGRCREHFRVSVDEMCSRFEALLTQIFEIARQECVLSMPRPAILIREKQEVQEEPCGSGRGVGVLEAASLVAHQLAASLPDATPSPLGQVKEETVESEPVLSPPNTSQHSPDPAPMQALSEPSSASGPPFSCPVCGRQYRHKHNLKVHRRVHSGERPYVCPLCGKTFIASNMLKDHVSRHSRKVVDAVIPEKPFACDLCGKRYSLRVNLSVHRKSHFNEDEFPFKCDECGKAFKRTNHLANHQRVHSVT